MQDERKAAGLAVSDRIHLTLTVTGDRLAAIGTHGAFVATETLATALDVVEGAVPDGAVALARVERAERVETAGGAR